MSTTGSPEVFDAAQGGVFQGQEEPAGFHKELQNIQDAVIKQKQGAIAPDAPAQGGIADAVGNAVLGFFGKEVGEAQKWKAEKIRPRHDTVYRNELEPNSAQILATGDKLTVTEKGEISLNMEDGGGLHFRNGEVRFNPGTTPVVQTTREGVTTLTFKNGDTVKYNQEGLIGIHRGFDSVSFAEKRETPADRLEKAIDNLTFKMDKEEALAVRDLATALGKGDTETIAKIARQFNENPEAMNRVVNTVNAALQAADIPRMSLYYRSSQDNLGNRTGALSVQLRHSDGKLSPTTNLQFNIKNGKESLSANFESFPNKTVPLKPAAAGQSFQHHIADPNSTNFDRGRKAIKANPFGDDVIMEK